MAFSTSPSDSVSAFLQSIIPAPVRSRRALTSLALIWLVLLTTASPLRAGLLRGRRAQRAPRREQRAPRREQRAPRREQRAPRREERAPAAPGPGSPAARTPSWSPP